MVLKGISQLFFPKDVPLETIFEKSKKAGFDAVELSLSKPGGVGITPDTTPAEAKAIKELAQKNELQVRSLLLGAFPFPSDDASEREQGRLLLEKQLELADVLGVDTVLVVPGRVNDKTPYDVCYHRSQEEISKVVPMAEKYRIHIAIENVWNKFLLSPMEMARYIDEMNSPFVGAYFDVGNVLIHGFPEQWIRILGKRIRKVHVKDFKVNVGNGNGFVPLLAGDVNWIEVRKALDEIGYDDVLTAELSPYASFPDQLLYDTARHLDVLITGEVK